GHSALLRGFLIQISNSKVVVFFGSIFVAMLPSEVPAWMIAALIALLTMNEIVWYSLVSLFFGSSPVRRFYLIAKCWLDRAAGASLVLLGFRLLGDESETAGGAHVPRTAAVRGRLQVDAPRNGGHNGEGPPLESA